VNSGERGSAIDRKKRSSGGLLSADPAIVGRGLDKLWTALSSERTPKACPILRDAKRNTFRATAHPFRP
jgi:hypothetical protein